MDWILQNAPWILSKTWKHRLAIYAAWFAIAVSLGQAVNAFRKGHKHKELQNTNPSLTEVLEDDVKHFLRVGILWFIGFLGALVTLLAEMVDKQLDS